MKLKSLFLFLLPLGFLAAFAFKGNEGAELAQTAPPKLYVKDWVLDTILNAAKDTLLLPATDVQSNYEWSYHITRTSISGTANVAVSVQASGVRTGNNDWTQVAITSGTGATNEILSSASFFGRRHRIIVNGTGTQSTSYRITAVLKLKN